MSAVQTIVHRAPSVKHEPRAKTMSFQPHLRSGLDSVRKYRRKKDARMAKSIRFRFEKHWNSTEMRQVLRRKRVQEDVPYRLALAEAMDVLMEMHPNGFEFPLRLSAWDRVSFLIHRLLTRTMLRQ
jgi:hypothetical protein